MRICVLGAGATGGHFALKLGLAGHDVSVVARGAHLEAIRALGITLKAGQQSWLARPRASDDPATLGVHDVVIVGVKATALATMAGALAPLVDSQTAVIFPQNGMPWWYPRGLSGKPEPPPLPIFGLADAFLPVVPSRRIVGGLIYSANDVVRPGVIVNNSPGHNRLDVGAIEPDTEIDVAAIAALLQEAGIASHPLEDVRAAVWRKLLVNMSSSTIALATGNRSSISQLDPELGEIFRRIIREGMAVCAAHGYRLDEVVDPDRLLASLSHHRPSLLQDYERGRPMEIGEIVRAPQAFARSAGVATPTLDAVSAIVTRLARDRGLYAG